MTAPRNITTQWTGGTTSADVVLPDCEPGDLLLILVGGGNRTTNTPTGWNFQNYLTGQEAQGCMYDRTADGTEGGSTVTINFDGTDQRYIVALAVRDWVGWDDWIGDSTNDANRVGTAGGTYAAGAHSWTADQYQGDLLITFAFARNSAAAPTVNRGVLWEAQTGGGASAALYLESAPSYEVDAAFAIDYAERSGHVSYSIPVFDYTWTEWQTDPPYERVKQPPIPEARNTKLRHDTETVWGGPMPIVDQSDFLLSQANQEWDEDGVSTPLEAFTPASWSSDTFIDISGNYTRDWGTHRRYHVFPAQLQPSDLVPLTVELDTPPEGYEGIEYDGDHQVIGVWSHVHVTDHAYDDSDGSSDGLNVPAAFSTVMRRATGLTWNAMPTSDHIADWDRTYDDAAMPIWLRGTVLNPGSTDETIYLTNALDPDNPLRLAVVVYVAGVNGVGDPLINLKSYDQNFQGGAEFGAGHNFFQLSEEGGGLHWEIQPAPVRFLVRRQPVVDLEPPVIAVLRRYPRDDAYGFGNVKRNYPPPRRLRNYGQQP